MERIRMVLFVVPKGGASEAWILTEIPCWLGINVLEGSDESKKPGLFIYNLVFLQLLSDGDR